MSFPPSLAVLPLLVTLFFLGTWADPSPLLVRNYSLVVPLGDPPLPSLFSHSYTVPKLFSLITHFRIRAPFTALSKFDSLCYLLSYLTPL